MELKQILNKEEELTKKIEKAKAASREEIENLKKEQEEELNSGSFLSSKEKEKIASGYAAKIKEQENEAKLKLNFSLKEIAQNKERNEAQALDFIIESISC